MVDTQLFTPFPPELVKRYRSRGYWGTRTIGEELRALAAANPEVEAVVGSDRRLTFSELDARTDAIGTRLVSLGLRKGDIVLLQIGNTVESVEAFYGLIKMGAIPVCSLIPFGHHEIDAIGRIVGARAHLVQADLADRDLVTFAHEVQAAVPTMEFVLTIRGTGPGAHRIDDAPDVTGPIDFGVDDPDAMAVMQLSGGTTGTPKAIPRLHAEYWYNGYATAQRFGYSTGDRVAHFLPIVHNAGLHSALFAAHSVGATVILGATWTPDLALSTLQNERITHFGMMTSLIASILDDPRFETATATVRRIGVALSGLTPEVFAALEAKGVTVCQFFGMSEGFACSVETTDPPEMRLGTVGYPLSPDDEFILTDPESGVVLEGNGPGELCVRGPYTLRGYYNAAEHNAVAFTADGYLRTGDVVSVIEIDGKQCLRIEGRQKDLISRGGEKINASEIEALLVQLPGVLSAALVAMRDERLGERACAFLITEDGELPTMEATRAFLAERGVAKYKWPERLEAIDAFPTTPVGKVSKLTLRELLADRVRVTATV